VQLDPQRSVVSAADFGKGEGVIQLVGRLTLNDHNVELHASVDLATLQGEGSLSARSSN